MGNMVHSFNSKELTRINLVVLSTLYIEILSGTDDNLSKIDVK